jgi:hypothetical protein
LPATPQRQVRAVQRLAAQQHTHFARYAATSRTIALLTGTTGSPVAALRAPSKPSTSVSLGKGHSSSPWSIFPIQ